MKTQLWLITKHAALVVVIVFSLLMLLSSSVNGFENLEERNRILNSQSSLRALSETSNTLAADFKLKAYVDPINGNSDISNNCSIITSPCSNLLMVFNLFERFPNYVPEGKTAILTIYLLNNIENGQNCGLELSSPFQQRIQQLFISTDSIQNIRKLSCAENQQFLKSATNSGGSSLVIQFFLMDLSNINIVIGNNTEIWTKYCRITNSSFTGKIVSILNSEVYGQLIISESPQITIDSSAFVDSFLNLNTYDSTITIQSTEFHNSLINLQPKVLAYSTRSLTISQSKFYHKQKAKNDFSMKNSNYFITNQRYPFEISIKDCEFEGSGSDLDNVGGISVPHIFPYSLSIDRSIFRNLYSKEGGAALYLSGYSKIVISFTLFDSNRSPSMGGAILLKGLSSSTFLSRCTFQNNQQTKQEYTPGGSSSSSSSSSNDDSTTSSNTLCGGGAIYFAQDSPSTLQSSSCTYRNNSAGGLGGAILSYCGKSDEFTFENSQIVENRAGYYGGGVAILVNPVVSSYDAYVSSIESKGTTISGNEAIIGGGLFVNNIHTISLDSTSYLNDNVAFKYAPALFYNKVISLKNNAVSNNNYIKDDLNIIQSPTTSSSQSYPSTIVTLLQSDDTSTEFSTLQIIPGSTQLFYALFKDSNGNIANTSLLFNMQSYWKISLASSSSAGNIIVDDLNFYPSSESDLLVIELKTSLRKRLIRQDSFSLRMSMDTKSNLQAFSDIQVVKSFNVTVGSCGPTEYLDQRSYNDGSDYFVCSNRASITVGVTISVLLVGCIVCVLMALFTVKFCLLYRDQRRKARKEKELESKLMDFELNYTKLGDSSFLNSQSGGGMDYWMIKEEDIEIQQKIAEGGQGSVFKGKWKNKTQVAIKTFKFNVDEDTQDAFQQEVALLRAVHHENIVTFYGVVILDTTQCVVTEFVPNNSLEYWIAKMKKGEKKISFKEKLKILLDIAAAMSYLHELNPPIIHRDLKPANVLLDNQMKAKICDLGVSKIVADHMVEKTNQIGTFNFMAIETFSGTDYNEKCDVFSFSIIMWQMLFEENAIYSNELLKNKRVSCFITDKDREIYEKLTPNNFNNYYIAKLIGEGLRYPLPSLSKTLEDEKKLFVWVEEFMNDQEIDTGRLTVRILPIYFSLIESCWRAEYNQRPSFTFIVKKLQELIEMV